MLVLAFSNYQLEKLMWNGKKEDNSKTEKYRVVDKNLRERLESGNTNICELHYKKDDIEFTSKLQNTFLYFGHAYCLA